VPVRGHGRIRNPRTEPVLHCLFAMSCRVVQRGNCGWVGCREAFEFQLNSSASVNQCQVVYRRIFFFSSSFTNRVGTGSEDQFSCATKSNVNRVVNLVSKDSNHTALEGWPVACCQPRPKCHCQARSWPLLRLVLRSSGRAAG
jgi:hypothetical protein